VISDGTCFGVLCNFIETSSEHSKGTDSNKTRQDSNEATIEALLGELKVVASSTTDVKKTCYTC
jgi:hypothetical protein